MNATVLTIESEEESAKRLGFPTKTYSEYKNELNSGIVIRMGNSCFPYNEDSGCSEEYDKVINLSKAICLNCNKDEALATMAKVVPTPKMYRQYEKVPNDGLYVYRPVNHSGGKGFKVVQGGFEVSGGCYATRWIDTQTEYRAWFCNGNVLLAQRVTQNAKRLKEKYPCRSLWPYKFVDTVPSNLKKLVKLAVDSIGLEICACDILYKDGKYIWVENNSCPTIDHWRIEEFFKDNITKLIKKKFPKG